MLTNAAPSLALEQRSTAVSGGPGASPAEAKLNPGARQLSKREESVLLLAAHGLTDKEIARHLELSQRTVGTYWERMREKLGRLSRTELVARFVRLDTGQEPAECGSLLSTCETSLSFLSENSTDLIARFDSKLICVEVNPSWGQIVSTDEVVGKSIRELEKIFRPNSTWIRCLTTALKDAKSVSFRSHVDGIKPALRTSLLPVPADGEQPNSVISITAVDCVKELLAS